ncbi:ABC-three component system protein, partial [Acinetobacter baumannii]
MEDLHPARTAEERGRFVYRQCARLEPPLEGRAVPGHFVNGSFNDLADRRQLGWHADYKQLLAGGNQ